jgi:hypothetical protein
MRAMTLCWIAVYTLLDTSFSAAQETPANYDESKVPEYQLPAALKMLDGSPVENVEQWHQRRRPELLEQFTSQVYGRVENGPRPSSFEQRVLDRHAVEGLATHKVTEIVFDPQPGSPRLRVHLFLPNGGDDPVPIFVGMHLFPSSETWPRPGVPTQIKQHAPQRLDGKALGRFILQRGYALATLDAEEVAPDDRQRYREGLLGQLTGAKDSPRKPDSWGAISAWAWALSRALDSFEEDPAIDHKRVIVIGHSRMGKTALWAAAVDPRFAMTISNDSGAGGAALSRRRFGETVARINSAFPHWFCENFHKFSGREDLLPVDQHLLIALSAPRPIYVASALEDRWADPKGEFLAARDAGVVYHLFGLRGLEEDEPPFPDRPIGDHIGYHLRRGKHDLTDYDWRRYLDFADRHLGKPD